MGTRYVGVIGPSDAGTGQLAVAETIGRMLAHESVVVVTGGLGGVMEAASRGAQEVGGVTLGLLPGSDRARANQWLTIAVPTGLGEMRNALLVRTSDALIAIGGSWGTLSEIALAVRTGVPVVALGGWTLPEAGVIDVQSAGEAVQRVLDACGA